MIIVTDLPLESEKGELLITDISTLQSNSLVTVDPTMVVRAVSGDDLHQPQHSLPVISQQDTNQDSYPNKALHNSLEVKEALVEDSHTRPHIMPVRAV